MIHWIIWDWNGTLVDDADYARSVTNGVLQKHHLPILPDLQTYRTLFCFPVRTFYDRVGLGGELYDTAAVEWTEGYYAHEKEAPLRAHIPEVLEKLHQSGINQVIISASPQPALVRQVGHYPIGQYFEGLMGLSDIHARSKVHLAQGFIEQNRIDPSQVLFVGDSVHDTEVAEASGARCVLLEGGHQLMETISKTGVPVLEDVRMLPDWIEKNG